MFQKAKCGIKQIIINTGTKGDTCTMTCNRREISKENLSQTAKRKYQTMLQKQKHESEL